MTTRGLPSGPASGRFEQSGMSECLDYLLLRSKPQVVQSPVLGYGPGTFLFVQQSSVPLAGCGLFSRSSFVPGDIITLYDGIAIPNVYRAFANTAQGASLTHACKIKGTEYTILGLSFVTKGRGLGSFANHSHFNNARLITKNFPVRYYNQFDCPFLKKCVLLQACRPISPGQEIFVRYSKNTLARLTIPQ